MALRDTLFAKHGVIVKMSEKRHFNGFRLSPHILNRESACSQARSARPGLLRRGVGVCRAGTVRAAPIGTRVADHLM
jgi:hypothetical protein